MIIQSSISLTYAGSLIKRSFKIFQPITKLITKQMSIIIAAKLINGEADKLVIIYYNR